MVLILELRHLILIRIYVITINVDGTLDVIIQHYGLDLLTITIGKTMDQGKEMENTFAQETVLVL